MRRARRHRPYSVRRREHHAGVGARLHRLRHERWAAGCKEQRQFQSTNSPISQSHTRARLGREERRRGDSCSQASEELKHGAWERAESSPVSLARYGEIWRDLRRYGRARCLGRGVAWRDASGLQAADCRQLTAAGVRWYELVGERYSFDASDLSGAMFDKTSLYASTFDNAMARAAPCMSAFVGAPNGARKCVKGHEK